MDRETLKNYRDLNIEIKRLKKRISNLETKIEHDKVSGSNSEFPYQPITVNIEGLGGYSKRAKMLRRILESRIEAAESQQLEIEEWIRDIFDSRIRMVMEMYYIEGKSFLEISRHLGSNHESYSRKIRDRYLK